MGEGVGAQQDEAPRRPGRPARPVTREHLLRVAREAFSELGYAGASMGDIAGRAGIRKSSLFHHFATKDDLYRDALTSVVQDITQQVTQSIGASGPLLERMDRASLAVQRYFGQHPVAARLLLREFVDGGPRTSAAGEAVDNVLALAVNVLETAMSEGVIPRQDSRQLTMSIAGAHLLCFAIPEVSSRFLGANVFAPDAAEARALLVAEHVRRLIGVCR